MKVIRSGLKGLVEKGKIVFIEKPFPLMGHIGFGIIDRGYNLLQVRVSSVCNLSCIFCSVNAGANSPRIKEFMLNDVEWLSIWINRVLSVKKKVHILFDAAGDPLTNPKLPEFIEETKKIRGVLSVSLETRLYPTNIPLIEKLDDAGLDRINVSLDTLDPKKGRMLTGSPQYDVGKIMEAIEYIHDNTGIDIHLTPLWIPGVNDPDIEKIIVWAKEKGFGRKWPGIGIQKYVIHKLGRKIPGIKEWSWNEFYEKLQALEKKYGIRLVLYPEDFDMKRSPRFMPSYKKGDIVKLIVYMEGWLRNEYIATTAKRDWVFTILSRKMRLERGERVVAKVVRDKDGILLAKPL
jgi:uncharacterized Fe-S cluster-containing radical SAM superfamily enzyme